MTKRSAKLRKTRVSEDARIARAIDLPMYRKGEFEPVDISNHSDADQRTMVRSGERRTIRRKPKVDELVTRQVITKAEAAYVEWYVDQHEDRYGTRLRIAQWEASAGSTDKAYGHWPAGMELGPGMSMLDYARSGISAYLRDFFDSVVLRGARLGKRSLAFRVAVEQLITRIEGKVQL